MGKNVGSRGISLANLTLWISILTCTSWAEEEEGG